MITNEPKENGITGIIPDFFHDVIAYITPGYTALIIVGINIYVASEEYIFDVNNMGFAAFMLLSVIAYVIGRFFEQLGYSTIHNKGFPFYGKRAEIESPKLSLLFNESENDSKGYTPAFRTNLQTKITEWLESQNGRDLLSECESIRTDDYFNLIQFYLRERFPSVALYEKKQNATIVLTRSLSIIFLLNIPVYFLTLSILSFEDFQFSLLAAVWISLNLIFSYFFYKRFRLDKKYHAMYIFETFIAMKKLLISKGQ